jgi:hypothetical protein
MAITKNTGRQWPLVAVVDIAYSDTPTTATLYEAADLPPTARVIGGALVVKTAWATATTALFAVGDTGAADRYLTSQTLLAEGTFPFDFASDDGSAPLDVGVTYTETGSAATAGAAQLIIEYVLDGKANETQPSVD